MVTEPNAASTTCQWSKRQATTFRALISAQRCRAMAAAAALGQRPTQPVVMYHYPCPDGVFAALAAHLHFRSSGSDVRWVPNRVYAPETVAGLALQVSCLLTAS